MNPLIPLTQAADEVRQLKVQRDAALEAAAHLADKLAAKKARIAELLELLAEARDLVASDLKMRKDMYSKYPSMSRKWKPEQELLDAIDAALAKGKK